MARLNFAHLHLVLTHFPPVLSLGSALSAVGGLLLRRRRDDLIRIALVMMIGVGAMMPLVYLAGERAADSIGKVEGVQQEAIAPHQRAATIALAVSVGSAVIAMPLFVVELRRGGLSSPLRLLVLVAAVASAGAIGWTANLGGAIHHPEITESP